MVYVVQNYLASFGLYPSLVCVKFYNYKISHKIIWILLDSTHRLVCGSFTKDHVSET
jgi:hypothetical protein